MSNHTSTKKKPGLPPGTLIHIGEKKTEKTQISLIDYSASDYETKAIKTPKECLAYKEKKSISWINVSGLHNTDTIEELGDIFKIHPLILEDILNTNQRPKFEDYDALIFVVLKMLYHDPETKEITVEQVSLVLGEDVVISFQEKEGDVFGLIRDRIKNAKGRIRKMGADYLLYALMDTIIDYYFVILEEIGEKTELIEDSLIKNPSPETLQTIQNIKKNILFLRKAFWPLRELISGIERSGSPLIKNATGIYLRDMYDHTIQVIDTVETFRDITAGMLDIYLSNASNRMNEIMKVLTIFAAIFIPLTFIAGIYGMNFVNMPELKWKYGYYLILGVMGTLGFSMLFYFRKKKWM